MPAADVARGQEDPARAHPVPTAGQRVLVVAGAVGGALTVGSIGPFAPLAIGAATYGTSAALGLRPTVGGVALDTAVGVAVGVAGYATTVVYLTEVQGYAPEFGVDVAGLVVGLAVAAALVAPTGERAAGLSVRVGL